MSISSENNDNLYKNSEVITIASNMRTVCSSLKQTQWVVVLRKWVITHNNHKQCILSIVINTKQQCTPSIRLSLPHTSLRTGLCVNFALLLPFGQSTKSVDSISRGQPFLLMLSIKSAKSWTFPFCFIDFSTDAWKLSAFMNVWPCSRYRSVMWSGPPGRFKAKHKVVYKVYKVQFLFCPLQLSHQITTCLQSRNFSHCMNFMNAEATSSAFLPASATCRGTRSFASTAQWSKCLVKCH